MNASYEHPNDMETLNVVILGIKSISFKFKSSYNLYTCDEAFLDKKWYFIIEAIGTEAQANIVSQKHNFILF